MAYTLKCSHLVAQVFLYNEDALLTWTLVVSCGCLEWRGSTVCVPHCNAHTHTHRPFRRTNEDIDIIMSRLKVGEWAGESVGEWVGENVGVWVSGWGVSGQPLAAGGEYLTTVSKLSSSDANS